MRNILAIGLCAILVPAALANILEEHFDDLLLPGWAMQNNSEPLGTTDWFQGSAIVFPPQATSGYIAANYDNAGSGAGPATISNWLITPEVTLQNGYIVRFYTRCPDASIFPDRLQVRMSLAGSSTGVGSTATSVGDFTELLLDINPTYQVGGYPEAWKLYEVEVSGLGAATNGRFAFRYFVENGGSSGTRSDYIGIDTFVYDIPEPASLGLVVLGALVLIRRR